MGSKFNGNPGLYEFLIEAELQQYYNTLKNELKVSQYKECNMNYFIYFKVTIIQYLI